MQHRERRGWGQSCGSKALRGTSVSVVSRASLKWSLSATQAQLWTAHSVALCSPVAGGDCRPGVKDARRPRILLFPPVRAAVSLSHQPMEL